MSKEPIEFLKHIYEEWETDWFTIIWAWITI